jgi:hypothetical protein
VVVVKTRAQLMARKNPTFDNTLLRKHCISWFNKVQMTMTMTNWRHILWSLSQKQPLNYLYSSSCISVLKISAAPQEIIELVDSTVVQWLWLIDIIFKQTFLDPSHQSVHKIHDSVICMWGSRTSPNKLIMLWFDMDYIQLELHKQQYFKQVLTVCKAWKVVINAWINCILSMTIFLFKLFNELTW